MPRLTDRDYLFLRTYLHAAWCTKQKAFSLISTQDQYYLHRYFRPSEDMSAADALAHRKAATASQPSLPQCAGRALRHLVQPKRVTALDGNRRLVVHPLLRPEPDVGKLATALLALARAQATAVPRDDGLSHELLQEGTNLD
jgi:hypothetical protein